ncbi:MAG: hypothetical protein FWC70_05575 [Defluviitaleaceae bacterium]|nr:hypothetical protein [Defluviitaleaceae bacterium]
MFDNATVTLPLEEFDRLRSDEAFFRKKYREIASHIAGCFEYSFSLNAYPQECETCPTAKEDYSLPKDEPGVIHATCTQCAVFKNYKPANEILIVDTERLKTFAKQHAVWGKGIETDVSAIPLKEKAGTQ